MAVPCVSLYGKWNLVDTGITGRYVLGVGGPFDHDETSQVEKVFVHLRGDARGGHVHQRRGDVVIMEVCLHTYIVDVLLEKYCLKRTKMISHSNIAVRGVSPRHSDQTHLTPLGFRIWPIDPVSPMSASHTHGEIEVNFLTRGRVCYLHAGREVWMEPFRFTALWAGLPH
jgi:hypothetical protein